MSDHTFYPELTPVLSLARSTVTDAFRLTGDQISHLIDDVERLGAEAMIETYAPLRTIVISMSDPTAGATSAPPPPPWTESFADQVAAMAATLYRRSNEFASWVDAAPPTAEGQVAATLLSQAASRSFAHAQAARKIETPTSPEPNSAPSPAYGVESPSDDTSSAAAHRIALGACYDVAVEIMTVATHRAIYHNNQDP